MNSLDLNKAFNTYTKDGVTIARDFFSHSIIHAALQESIYLARIVNANKYNPSVFWKRQSGQVFLEKFEPVINRSKVFRAITRNRKLLKFVSTLLRDNKTYLLKDKLIYKYPGQNGYPLHQDYNWWHDYPANDICTVVIPLEKATLSNGGIEFFIGCHTEAYLPEGENREFHAGEIQALSLETPVSFDLEPGDILAFHSLTPHFSGRNMSNTTRTQFYPTFCSGNIGNVYRQQLVRHRELIQSLNPSNIY